MNNPFDLIGKNIVVTGASSGIGQTTAIECSRMGARVVLLGRDQERLDSTLAQMHHPEQHYVFSIDITDYAQVEPVLKQARERLGNLHGLVNAAGISTTLPLKLISPEKLDAFFKTNVIAAINLAKIFTKLDVVSREGGSIIFISSVMGVVGEAGKTMYSLSKGALIAGTRSLALELASKKIRVNAISPGVVETPMSQNAIYSQDEESKQRILSLHPLGLGTTTDIAHACIYLLSNASRWITGTNLIIDGGYTSR